MENSECVFYEIPDVCERNYRYGDSNSRYNRVVRWYIRSKRMREKTYDIIFNDTVSPTKFIRRTEVPPRPIKERRESGLKCKRKLVFDDAM